MRFKSDNGRVTAMLSENEVAKLGLDKTVEILGDDLPRVLPIYTEIDIEVNGKRYKGDAKVSREGEYFRLDAKLNDEEYMIIKPRPIRKYDLFRSIIHGLANNATSKAH